MLSNEDLLAQAKKDIPTAWRAASKWRKKARESYDFEAGNQWDEEDMDRLRKVLKRAAFTFNRIKPMINAVVGMEIGNRQEIKCTPREPNDNGAAGVFDMAVQWARDLSGMPEEESDAWKDMLITGMGWTESSMDYSESLDGKIMIERKSPLEMFWDQDATRRNIIDAMMKGSICMYSKAKFKSRWPEFDLDNAKAKVFGVGSWNPDNDSPHNNDPDLRYSDIQPDSDSSSSPIAVAKYEYCVYEPWYYVSNPMRQGETEKYDEKTFTDIRDKMEGDGFAFYERGEAGAPDEGVPVPYVKLNHKRWYLAYFTGEEVISHDVNPDPNVGTLHTMTGSRDEKTGFWYGIVEGAKDPQMLLNKVISSMVDIFNFGAKGGLVAEEDAFTNPDQAQEDFANPTKILMVAPGKLGATTQRLPAPLPPAVGEIVKLAIDGLPATTGIAWESVGVTGKDQPGILEQTRKQSAMATMSGFFDALRQYRIRSARTMLYFIQNYLDPQLLIRIGGQNIDPNAVSALKDEDVLTYDIVVGDAPNNPNQRDAVLKVMMDMMQYSEELGKLLFPMMIPYLPLPAPLLLKMQAQVEESNQPNPKEQIAELLAAQKAIADIREVYSQSALNDAKAGVMQDANQIKAVNTQLDFLSTMVGHFVAAHRDRMKANASGE